MQKNSPEICPDSYPKTKPPTDATAPIIYAINGVFFLSSEIGGITASMFWSFLKGNDVLDPFAGVPCAEVKVAGDEAAGETFSSTVACLAAMFFLLKRPIMIIG